MILVFFSLLLGTTTFLSFSVSVQANTLNRIVTYTPKQIFESSIPLIQEENDKPNLYFDKEQLFNKLKNYYDEKIKTYIDEYTLELFFYNPSDDSLCVSEYCTAVKVTVSATLAFSHQYERCLYYEIHKGANYAD